jgi:HAD superfamily hydrolase (TIGR01549 family)
MGNGQPAAWLRGVVFDMDGTLVRQELDFEAIRREIGLPTGTPLLEALEALAEAERGSAWTILNRHEQSAAALAELIPGVTDFLDWLDGHGVRRAVLTRNSRSSAETVLARCGLTGFDPVVAREDGPFKPHPAGVWRACEAWGVPPDSVLMLGDYLYDIQAGRRAGSRTALLTHGRTWPFAAEADFVFSGFHEGAEALAGLE